MGHGAAGSFEEYATSQWHRLVRFGFLLCGDWGAAEDVVQDALVSAHRHWPRVREMDSPDAYIRRAILNRHLSLLRHRRVTENLVDVVPEPVPERSVVEDEEYLPLWLALRGLPSRMRATLVLRYHEQLSEVEIAKALGCSIGTVKSQMSRGLARLRLALASAASPEVSQGGQDASPRIR
jgi:RNA polymerase sigma-70 factor (sigma-E family)